MFNVYVFKETITKFIMQGFPPCYWARCKKKKPVHATNQIAGSGEFHPLTKLEKK